MTVSSNQSMSTTALLANLCSQHSLPQPLYDLEAVGSSFTMCCIVGRFKETSSDKNKEEAKKKAAAKVYERLKTHLDKNEDTTDSDSMFGRSPDSLQSSLPGVTPSWLVSSERRPSVEDLKTKVSLEELCIDTGLPAPVYDMEAVGSEVTMFCIAGTVKQTASDRDRHEAKRKAANKVMEKLLKKFQLEENQLCRV